MSEAPLFASAPLDTADALDLPRCLLLCDRAGATDVVKVLDFGLVKRIDEGADPSITAERTVLGTPAYLAPEAILSADAIDARADVYAVGAVGYFLLTGTPVFRGRSLIEIFSKHLSELPDPFAARGAEDVPRDIEEVVRACLEKYPSNRPRARADAAPARERSEPQIGG